MKSGNFMKKVLLALFVLVILTVYSCFKGLTLINDCLLGCNELLWRTPYEELDEELVAHLRREHFVPPREVVPNPLRNEDVYGTSWKNLSEWSRIMNSLKLMFKGKEKGAFVEIGSGSGDILSMTSWLEEEKGWEGLLVESNPALFSRLKARRRSALAQLCASNKKAYYQTELWIPRSPPQIEEPFRTISEMSSRVVEYVDKTDMAEGEVTRVQCVPINAILKAAQPYFMLKKSRKVLHLLVIDTNGGESEILELLTTHKVMVLLIKADNVYNKERIIFLSQTFNLVLLFPKQFFANFLLFVNHNFVEVKPF